MRQKYEKLNDKCIRQGAASGAYELHGATGAFDDEVGHVADEVGSEAEIEEHVEYDEDHLDGVDGVEVAVADGGHGGDGPVDGGDVAYPEARLLEVWIDRPDPRPPAVRVQFRQQIVHAPGAVHQQQRHLYIHHIPHITQ